MNKFSTFIMATSICASIHANAQNKLLTMAVGTYTATESKGIYLYTFNQENGTAELRSTIKAQNPSFVAFSANGKTIYAVDESGKSTDAAISFDITTGKPTGIAKTDGEAPCYISTNGNIAATANYTGGSITAFKIGENGEILNATQHLKFQLTGKAPDKGRQESAHIHCVRFSPDNTHLFATDLGNDCIYRFKIENNTLIQDDRFDLHPGSGPRHLTFSNEGKHAYLVTELSGEVVVFNIENNVLIPIQTIDCDKYDARGSADIHLSPDGKFLYASNRLKNDGIAIFKIDQSSGMLSAVGYQSTGIHPRNFAITPNGKYLLCACRDSNRIEVYERNAKTGLLKNTGNDIELPQPVCITFQ